MRSNSTIKDKVGVCVDCPEGSEPKILISGRCETHYWIYRNRINLEKKKKDTKSLIGNSMVDKETELLLWFQGKMASSKPICENCGVKADWILGSQYKKLWKSAQAHILPKKLFHSIKTHPDNHMVLFAGYSGVCYCHDDFDSSWSKASSMKVWPIAKSRFELFVDDIAPSERHSIPKVFYKK